MTQTADPDFAHRLARAKFRAWHRGTREADYTMGCFFDRFSPEWGEAELAWFETLLEEDDVDILGWVIGGPNGIEPAPEKFAGALLETMKRLDYVEIPR